MNAVLINTALSSLCFHQLVQSEVKNAALFSWRASSPVKSSPRCFGCRLFPRSQSQQADGRICFSSRGIFFIFSPYWLNICTLTELMLVTTAPSDLWGILASRLVVSVPWPAVSSFKQAVELLLAVHFLPSVTAAELWLQCCLAEWHIISLLHTCVTFSSTSVWAARPPPSSCSQDTGAFLSFVIVALPPHCILSSTFRTIHLQSSCPHVCICVFHLNSPLMSLLSDVGPFAPCEQLDTDMSSAHLPVLQFLVAAWRTSLAPG